MELERVSYRWLCRTGGEQELFRYPEAAHCEVRHAAVRVRHGRSQSRAFGRHNVWLRSARGSEPECCVRVKGLYVGALASAVNFLRAYQLPQPGDGPDLLSVVCASGDAIADRPTRLDQGISGGGWSS